MAERQHINPMMGSDENPLSNIAMQLAVRYQQLLAADGINASGDLSKSAISYILQWKGDTLMLTFRLPEYWYYVEHGRRPTSGVTGQRWENPVEDILKWMRVKRVLPSSAGRVPHRKPIPKDVEERRMAYAIVKKIHREGFYSPGHQGKHPLERAIDEVGIKEKLRGILSDAFGREIKVELADVVNTFKK